MTSNITLEGVTFAIAGVFEAIDADDAKWGLIARGARASATVGKRTQVLIAGKSATPSALKKAEIFGVSVVGEAQLHRLLGGESLRAVLAGPQQPPSAPRTDVSGLRFSVSGDLSRFTHAQVKVAVEALGGTFARKPSTRTQLLVVGKEPGIDAIEAMDAGLPRIAEPAFAAILDGAPVSEYVGFVDVMPAADASETIERLVKQHLNEVLALDGFDALYPDVLVVTSHPTGWVSFCLTELGGTPTEDHVRDVLKRATWPKVTHAVEVTLPITFGPPPA